MNSVFRCLQCVDLPYPLSPVFDCFSFDVDSNDGLTMECRRRYYRHRHHRLLHRAFQLMTCKQNMFYFRHGRKFERGTKIKIF